MTYKEIIEKNRKENSKVAWWPWFAFHFTDVTNVVSILSSGHLYSRNKASDLNVMHNDNASKEVISMTSATALSKVRFYFRPLTPTQYYNEGFKHETVRYEQGHQANIPVPVFLLFDLDKLLSMPNVQFSSQSQAGHGCDCFSGQDDFSKLPFDKIYANTFCGDSDERNYRHAEILYPNDFEIDSCIEDIICRNDIERMTLLHLLYDKSCTVFNKYKSIIKVYKQDVFYCNGLFVSACSYNNGVANITFSTNDCKKKYDASLDQKNSRLPGLRIVQGKTVIESLKGNTILKHDEISCEIDYDNPRPIVITDIQPPRGAEEIRIRFYLDDSIMSYIVQPLTSKIL